MTYWGLRLWAHTTLRATASGEPGRRQDRDDVPRLGSGLRVQGLPDTWCGGMYLQ